MREGEKEVVVDRNFNCVERNNNNNQKIYMYIYVKRDNFCINVPLIRVCPNIKFCDKLSSKSGEKMFLDQFNHEVIQFYYREEGFLKEKFLL